ncbi:hypothetical protein OIO90_004496 [Microbotryomycetes sp. JL221]|nr:hypothetical protein OIO90_004496 [Microbotryomycetes sp. JL221]
MDEREQCHDAYKPQAVGTLTADEERAIEKETQASTGSIASRTLGEGPFDEKTGAGNGDRQHTAGVTPVPTTNGSIPDGGLRAWLNVAGSFICMFLAFGFTNAWGVLQAYYSQQRYTNEQPSTIAWIGSIQMFCIFTMGSGVGVLYDRGYFRQILTVGSVLYLVGLFTTSLCHTFWQTILAQGICLGCGMSCMFLPPIALLSQYFARRRALAMGVAVVGSSVGGIVFPIFLNNMLARHSFGAAFRAPAYLCLGLLVIANFCLSESPTRPRRPAGVARPDPRQFFKETQYVCAALGAFFTSLGIFFPFFYLQVFAESKGLPKTFTQYCLAILNASSIFGRTIPNAIADYVGSFNMLIPMSLMTCVLVWAMFGADNLPGAIVFAILYGFSSGAYVSLVTPCFVSLSKSPTEIGARSGVAFIFVGVATLIGTPISGALLRRTPSFVAPICWSGIVLAIGLAFFIVARFAQAREKGTWKV